MSEYIFKQAENETHILKILPDNDAQNPREDDNMGKMICFHSKHNLGDNHNYSNTDAFILDLLTMTLGDSDKAERLIEKTIASFNRDDYKGTGSYYKAIDDKLFETIEKKFIVLPLFLYDHSGLTMSTGSFSCQWDSGQVGWIYASLEDIRKEYSCKNVTKAIRERAKKLLIAEVETFDVYLRGDIYGFRLEKKVGCEHCGNEDIEEVDSCWGFFGTDWKTNGILDNLGREYADLVGQL